MFRKMKFLAVLVLVFGLIVVGCGDPPDNTTYFTISYDAGEGGGSAPESQRKALGETFNLPGQRDMIAPSGKSFSGWRTSGQNYSAGGSFTVIGNTVFLAQWVSTSGEGEREPIVISREPRSVQAALNNVIVQQDSASSAQLRSASYDPDLGYIVVTVRVGTIKDMFLQYLSTVVVAEAGREFTYTEIRGHSETIQIENINTTAMNFSGTMWGAGAGAIAGASVFASLASLTGIAPEAKANAYAAAGASAGRISFDLASVTTSRYTQTYHQFLVITETFRQDMSIYPAGNRYALAAFADVGVYQLLRYDHETGTASAIPGKSLWFNVESRPVWDMYEYSREEELSIPQKLRPFERVNVVISEADLYASLIKTFSVTRSGENWGFTVGRSPSRDEIYQPNLLIPILKHFGYSKLKFDVAFRYNATIGFGNLWLRILNHNNTIELGKAEFGHRTPWTNDSFSKTVPIDATNSDSGQFVLSWNSDGRCNYNIGTRTITVTALK